MEVLNNGHVRKHSGLSKSYDCFYFKLNFNSSVILKFNESFMYFMKQI